ncbi:apolipoprotein N-acyltransferase [Roseovarius sp. TE539]|uniref:apolipoprotein N-acyltransferase n=1 Tax=Roseovarius sp. TE539 TaxID=2249812 RepID=UPI000DDF4ACD|nr:apolipoprotein N-acyltransferase [Roseovarius sp. TE539]RBI70539.1 apolipoprotein N-acyltransferase [Roseovarius sp. TE539]
MTETGPRRCGIDRAGGWRIGAAAASLGAVSALGQAPVDLWPLTLIALGGLFALFRKAARMKSAALIGFAAGTGYFLLALSWIVEPFLVDVARHGWMAPFALAFMAAGLGLFWSAGFAVARLAGGGVVAWVAALTLAEAARAVLFTGFPWAQVGHIWIDTPVLAWSAIIGPLGLSAVALAAGAGLFLALRARLKGMLVVAVVAALYLAAPLLDRAVPVSEDAPLVRLVQPNAPQDRKWDPDWMGVFFNRQIAFTADGADRPDLIVWPETSVPVPLHRAGTALGQVSEAAGDVPVVLGVQRREGARLYNSMVLLGPGGDVRAQYDKHHLVPFGEYLPFGRHLRRFGLRGLAAEDGNGFSAGPGPRVIDVGGIGSALPLICYEGVFARNVAMAPRRPDFLLLITNDAWFGDISGPHQHLAQARLRSAERGLPMIRVANTGISAVIDAQGRITGAIELGESGWTDLPLPPPSSPTIYSRTGDWPLILLLLAGLGATGAGRRGTNIN